MRRQRGIALITAILLVALATILAATIGYENAMSARRGTATFAFDQSLEVAKAAEAIAAYVLRRTRQTNATATYKGQYWSTPYGPLDLVPGVTLEAWLDDTQGRFNLNNLVNGDGTTNYDDQANQHLAKNLKGHLLLAHGTMDDNVPPYNTLLVVDELVKANKDFDLLLLPNQHHGYGSATLYMTRRRWDYFVRYLLGAEPPHEYELSPPKP